MTRAIVRAALFAATLAWTDRSALAGSTTEAPLDTRRDLAARLIAAPTAMAAGAGVKIVFESSAATDVEVAVLDAKGAVVRHLAAGLLGTNAPAPLARNALRQEILWDRKDDTGTPAVGAPFRVRVRLGSQARLEKYLGRDGNTLGAAIYGLAVGPRGEVFVLLGDFENNYGESEVRVLDREGRYLRTIMPYPANTPRERTDSIGQLEVRGERLPIVFNAHGHNLYPLTSGMKKQEMVFSPKGHLLMASAVGTMINHGPPRHLLALHPDGGAPVGLGLVGPRILEPRGFFGGGGERPAQAFDGLAVSPDGENIYLTTVIWSGNFTKYRQHGVFRAKWSDKELGDPFLGRKEPGNDDAHFNEPMGVAVDQNGRIYVCDRGNDRVMIFTAEGALAGKFIVESPEQIAVHPKGGEIYILSKKTGKKGDKPPLPKVLKFSPWGQEPPRELARLEGGLDGAIDLIALDPLSSPPRLWATFPAGWRGPSRLVPIEDKGAAFEPGKPVDNFKGIGNPMFVSVDEPRGRAYVAEFYGVVSTLDLATGEKKLFKKANEGVADHDGNVYTTQGWGITLKRFDPSGKPLPFAVGGETLGPWSLGKEAKGEELWARSKGPSVGDRGHVIAPNGDLYIIKMPQYGPGRIDVHGPDGKLKKEGLVLDLPHGSSGLAVDRDGNIYVGTNLRPAAGELFPHGFDGQAPADPWVWWRTRREAPWCYPHFNTYLYHWGAVLKFGPAGGRCWSWDAAKGVKPPDVPAGATEYRSGYLNLKVAVDGALWRYAGYGPVPTSGLNWGDPSCTCVNARMALDGYGRLFAPDVFRFSVEMIDAAGNQIARIGRYGNADDGIRNAERGMRNDETGITGSSTGSPDSALRIPNSAIHFAWPAFVSAGSEKIYVSDSANRRVTVVKFEYAAEGTCEIQ
jgi:sugar lactone lactonase YvrE